MDTDTSPQHENHGWLQVAIEFTDYATAEDTATTHLRPVLDNPETAGLVVSWSFIRKAPTWRLRYLSAPEHADAARQAVHQALDSLRENGRVAGWVETIYEPEVHAFGGRNAMTIAHELFHSDSQHILDGIRARERRRELTILLCSTLLRSAGQDWYEQGDIWARVAENRPLPAETTPDQVHNLQAGLQRLLTVDTDPASPLMGPGGQLSDVATWTAAFHTAGERLGQLARTGTLHRGLRAVLTHHVIFHWNRIGLPYSTQSLLAHTAKEAVLGD
ncbi:thiopeptide-type bacteriocin biosynthesis protein [Amycolatopsis sp. H20-H5]|uniref:thiopeptide-type bacteriocin biosynthesis protein n=1 Tax=Amycolatopsis sp. H20-H5 TaxID=3046309 RepID=UPI002DB621AB|nr:thiopeptide-type bacteriocin biosynthesis protein [Amycolatopsis sp. H20-H5]MEC3974277.1 thiopeptide-type bacteriocin biosynthesis protein [Amycolatopsis sp. H20-H5]